MTKITSIKNLLQVQVKNPNSVPVSGLYLTKAPDVQFLQARTSEYRFDMSVVPFLQSNFDSIWFTTTSWRLFNIPNFTGAPYASNADLLAALNSVSGISNLTWTIYNDGTTNWLSTFMPHGSTDGIRALDIYSIVDHPQPYINAMNALTDGYPEVPFNYQPNFSLSDLGGLYHSNIGSLLRVNGVVRNFSGVYTVPYNSYFSAYYPYEIDFPISPVVHTGDVLHFTYTPQWTQGAVVFDGTNWIGTFGDWNFLELLPFDGTITVG